ncbi:hypothetical protein C5167_050574 [Papaver somniferum]|uniref:TF-B3 domain-containing protein n=1 Tax=Papaver somniferum TaxID=3469 RepID=A0A4Y7KRT2_PAPSO|nr:hypothetical protein C5167_050574 [Papaver somniferum]
MQRGFIENEIRLKNSPPSSPNSTSSSSNSSSSDHSAAKLSRFNFSIPQFPSGFVGDEFIQEKNRNFDEFGDYRDDRRIIEDDRRKFLKSTVPIPVQNLMGSVPPGGDAATDSFSRNFMQNNGVLQSQLGTIGGRAELAPIPPKVEISWGQRTVENPCAYQYIPYNDISVSGNATPNLKRKAEVSTNSCDPAQMESLFGQFPSGPSKDSGSNYQVLQSGFDPVQALPQNPYFPITARSQPVNYSPIPPVNLEPTEKQEMDFFAKSWSQWSENSVGGSDASLPVNNRKVVRPRFSSSMSMAVISDENRNANSKPSAKNGYPLFPEHNALEAFPVFDHPSSSSHRPEAEEETARKGFVLLVQKELRNTDVGNLGRIVIPKKDAEANLPPLEAKDGIILQMEDMNYSVEWKFKYRYWPNNKSRMYVMENTGMYKFIVIIFLALLSQLYSICSIFMYSSDRSFNFSLGDFVKMHNLQAGDLLIVYREENSGKFIVRGKKGTRPVYAGDTVELRSTAEMRNHGRVVEERELATAHGQLNAEQRYAPAGDFFFDLNAGQDMIAPAIPFEFHANTGGLPKSHFLPGPLLNLHQDDVS